MNYSLFIHRTRLDIQLLLRWICIFGTILFLFLGLDLVQSTTGSEIPVEFNRDIRPILSDNCFSCHGPDEKTRQSGLRLDVNEASRTAADSGKIAVVPGKVSESELINRIASHDPAHRMPPLESGKHLSARQVELLTCWVNQGAKYQRHWSFVTPTRPQIDFDFTTEALGPIDVFVHSRLKSDGLTPAPSADRERLIRRATLDLTGTPPSLEELDTFLADDSADAYEKLIDRLMASPRYGERLTLDWLDAARFADTHGFNNDSSRSMWRWRDWTIAAYNSGMPFDQFITEQLAGDLLPNPSLDQMIATGFNRNHVINSEGGIIPEEYRVEYVADRVHTTATVLLGLSIGCARCHDHKFDPISQQEYYKFFAFFNQLDEKGEDGRQGNAEPQIPAPTPGQIEQKERLVRNIESLQNSLKQLIARQTDKMQEWEPQLRETYQTDMRKNPPKLRFPFNEPNGDVVVAESGSSNPAKIIGTTERVPGKLGGAIKFDGKTHVEVGDIASFDRTDQYSMGAWVYLDTNDAATVISRMDCSADCRGFDLLIGDGKLSAHLIHRWPDDALKVISKQKIATKQWKHVFVTYDGTSKADGLKLYIDGQLQAVDVERDHLTSTTTTTKSLRIGRRTDDAPFKGIIDEVCIYDRPLADAEVKTVFEFDGISDLLNLPRDQRTEEQTRSIVTAYLNRFDTDFETQTLRVQELEKSRVELEKQIPSAMIMREMAKRRPTYLLKRGQYDAPAEEVQPGVPASLPVFPKDAPLNRLGLANWLFSPENPLTSRVAVNRSWAMFFGNGLVETVEDFGSQGSWPSHLDLLDWLAVDFANMDGKGNSFNTNSRPAWDIKRLHRSIVSSATYRQSSRLTPVLLERDPGNKLLARGPRFRLQAEMIRDNALSIAGLLIDRTGGRSVSPYQPVGLWDDVAVGADYEGTVYKQDQGEGLYRRSMYTFWKRTCPPPGLNTFDAPEREFCMARRSRTNTPLQALVLLNDPTYLEAARKLAEQSFVSGGKTLEAKLTHAFRLCVSRRPTSTELDLLLKTYREQLDHYRKSPANAKSILSIGNAPHDESIDELELAAWTTVMSVLLNLDEVITKG